MLLVRPVIAALRDAPAFWRATELTPELVADTDARITPAQFAVAWAELVRQTHSAVALDIARHTPAGAFGIVEYVCRSAPTVGEALRRWVRYLNLLEDAVEVALVLEDDHACVRVIRECETPAHGARELCFALVARQARLRLSAEAVRDSALAASGLLSPTVGGPSVKPPQPASVSKCPVPGETHDGADVSEWAS